MLKKRKDRWRSLAVPSHLGPKFSQPGTPRSRLLDRQDTSYYYSLIPRRIYSNVSLNEYIIILPKILISRDSEC